MKLLFVTHWAKNMLVFRSELLRELGQVHEVYVLCPLDDDCAQFDALGVQHVPWKLDRGRLRNTWRSIGDLKEKIRTIDPDKSIIYCQQPILLFLVASYLTSVREFFPVFTGLGSLFTSWRPPTVRKRFLRWCVEKFYGVALARATRILVLNDDDRLEIARWNRRLEPQTFKTKGEGIDCDKFQPLSAKEKAKHKAAVGLEDNPLVVSFIGRFIGEKGIVDFLELAKRWPDRSGVKFVVAGTPDPGNPSSVDPKTFDRSCRENDILNLGWLADVKQALNITDVLLFPSYYKEGLPIAPQEAMAMGITVVGYRGTGLSELFSGIEDENLTAPGDVGGLAERIDERARHREADMILRAHIQQNYSLETCNRVFRRIVEI